MFKLFNSGDDMEKDFAEMMNLHLFNCSFKLQEKYSETYTFNS